MKKLLAIVILSFFFFNSIVLNAENNLLSEKEKEDFDILIIMNHSAKKPLTFTRDIDNNLIFSKNNYDVKRGKIKLNVCLLTNMEVSKEDKYYLTSVLAIEEAGLLSVENIYEKYGIKNIAKIAAREFSKYLEDRAAKENIKLKVETDCEHPSSRGRVKRHTTLYVIPGFLVSVLQHPDLLGIRGQDIFGLITYDKLKQLSDKYAKVKKENKNTKSKILESYKKYAENDSKEFMGSLMISLYGSGGDDRRRQRFCTLEYKESDGIAVVAYRLKGKEILVPGEFKDWYLNKGYLISHDKKNYYFDHKFSDINDAYLQIKNRQEKDSLSYEEFCNIFVDYPKNIMKLQTALQRDFGGKYIYGMLFSKKELNNKFATYKGFESYDQYEFSRIIGANLNQIKKFQKENILNYEDYVSIQNEIMNLNYSNYYRNDFMGVINYLVDKKESEKRGISVLAYKKLREEAEKEQQRRENEKKLERAKELDALKGAAGLAAKYAAACHLKSTGNTRKLLDGHINYLYQLVQNSKLPGYGNEEMYRQIISASGTILKIGKCN